MSDAKETPNDEAPKKKKGKLGKIIIMVVGVLVLLGGGVGAGLYAANSGLIGGGHAESEKDKAAKEEAEADASHPGPKLVPKAEQKRAGEGGEGGEGGHGGGGEGGEGGEKHENVGMKTPVGDGGERYASNYYQLPKDFTSNLRDSVHIVQIGLAVSTPYDDTVINNLKTNDLAVRSAILLTLGDASEEMVTTGEGKRQLQRRLVDAINEILRQKEGFGGIANVYFTNFVVQ
ncbi:flagellar basal body-associated protein FliL [uncultured Sphingomonas sp.]|uniref:flagellar basal body-associated FliL family protein n=1 Tax=uncultured Sphingomonas sp. TaxID=158754 RepID=UPI0025D203C8|nr:flagellar basal body-associated FliL family protein [uncultured Sphingomonas sp.]